jgi:putative Mg2+ transporter-C (MgtC) family protein
LTILLLQTEIPAETLGIGAIALRIGLAAILGMIVGFERKFSEKPAGARTMAMIAAGAAGFTLMGQVLAEQVTPNSGVQLDPTRIVSYIISGVGFLGAGAILHSKRGISGLTTASAIWASAGIGAASGLGLYRISIALFIVVFCALWLPWLGSLKNGDEPDAEDVAE